MHNDTHVSPGMVEYLLKLLCHVETRHSPVFSRSHLSHRDAAFPVPYNHLFSLAYFPNFLNSSGNLAHSSSSHALRCAFFMSMNMRFTSFWPCSRLFSRTPTTYASSAFFACSGAIAANKSSLGPSRLGLKSRHKSTSHVFTSVTVHLHSIDPLRRGWSLPCFRRRFLPRAELEDP